MATTVESEKFEDGMTIRDLREFMDEVNYLPDDAKVKCRMKFSGDVAQLSVSTK